MLATHDQVQDEIKKYTNNYWYINTVAKGVSGVAASAASLPFDFVKTRIQKQKPLPDGTLPYKNSIDCCKKTLQLEGPLAFYKGFTTYCMRLVDYIVHMLALLFRFLFNVYLQFSCHVIMCMVSCYSAYDIVLHHM